MLNYIYKSLFLFLCCLLAACNNSGHINNSNIQKRSSQANTVSLSYVSTVPLSKAGNGTFSMLFNNSTSQSISDVTFDTDNQHVQISGNECSNIKPGGDCQLTVRIDKINEISGFFTIRARAIGDAGLTLNAQQVINYSRLSEDNGFYLGQLPSYISANPGQAVSLAIPFKADSSLEDKFNVNLAFLDKADLVHNDKVVCAGHGRMCTALVKLPVVDNNLLKFNILKSDTKSSSMKLTTQISIANEPLLITPDVNVVLDQNNTTKNITLYNSGLVDIPAGGIIATPDTGVIQITKSTCTSGVTKGASCTLTVSMASNLTEISTPQILIEYNKNGSLGLSTIKFIVIPTHDAAGLLLSSSSNFVDSLVGQENTSTITVTNIGKATINNISFSNLNQITGINGNLSYGSQDLTDSCKLNGTQSLAANSSCKVKLIYIPSSVGSGKFSLYAHGQYTSVDKASHSITSTLDMYAKSAKQIILVGTRSSDYNVTCSVVESGNLTCKTNTINTGASGGGQYSFNSFYSKSLNKYYGMVNGTGRNAVCELESGGAVVSGSCKIVNQGSWPANCAQQLSSLANINGKNYWYISGWNCPTVAVCPMGESGTIDNNSCTFKSDVTYWNMKVQTIGNLFAIILRRDDGNGGTGKANPLICDIGTDGNYTNCVDSGVGTTQVSPTPDLKLNGVRGVSMLNVDNQTYLYFTGDAYFASSNGYIRRCKFAPGKKLINSCDSLTSANSGGQLLDNIIINQDGKNYLYATSPSAYIYRMEINSDGGISGAPGTAINIPNVGELYGLSRFIQYPDSSVLYDAGTPKLNIYAGFSYENSLLFNSSGLSKAVSVSLNNTSNKLSFSKTQLNLSATKPYESFLVTLDKTAATGESFIVSATVTPSSVQLPSLQVTSKGGAAFISTSDYSLSGANNLLCSYNPYTGLDWSCSIYAYSDGVTQKSSKLIFGSVAITPTAYPGKYTFLAPLFEDNYTAAYLYSFYADGKLVKTGSWGPTNSPSQNTYLTDSLVTNGYNNKYYVMSTAFGSNGSANGDQRRRVAVIKLSADSAKIDTTAELAYSNEVFTEAVRKYDVSVVQYGSKFFFGGNNGDIRSVTLNETNGMLAPDLASTKTIGQFTSSAEMWLSQVFRHKESDYMVVRERINNSVDVYRICNMNASIMNETTCTNIASFYNDANNSNKGKPTLWLSPSGSYYVYYTKTYKSTNYIYRREIIRSGNLPKFGTEESVYVSGGPFVELATISFLNP